MQPRHSSRAAGPVGPAFSAARGAEAAGTVLGLGSHLPHNMLI